MVTSMQKGRDGWAAQTDIELQLKPMEQDAKRILRIQTSKARCGISTSASVWKLDGRGMMSTVLYGDFRKTIAVAASRCTEKSVRTLHDTALASKADLLAQVNAHYGVTNAADQVAA